MTANRSSLDLHELDRSSVTVGDSHTRRALPIGLDGRLARAAHEAIARVVPSNARPALEFDWEDGSFRLEPDKCDSGGVLAEAFNRQVVVHRGREGGRIVIGDDVRASCNGWPIPPGVPSLLGHGDVVRFDDRFIAVRCDPPRRPLVEAGGWMRCPPPSDVAYGTRFAIEPFGEPLELRCDPTATRALVGVVLRHDQDRSFDPTALEDVERATLDWLMNRIANQVGADVFGGRATFRPAADFGSQVNAWIASVIRIGSAHGTLWIGTSEGGRKSLAELLAPIAQQQLRANPAMRGVYVTLSARLDLGRIDAARVAAVETGDLIATTHVPWIGDVPWTAGGRIALTAVDALSTPIQLDIDEGGRLRGTLLGRSFEDGGDPMMTAELHEAIDAVDQPFAEALDAIGVNVAVEIARRRIRLSEALALTAGDVFELGRPVSARVSLMVDGKQFASGELVNIEGTLGVRVLATGVRR